MSANSLRFLACLAIGVLLVSRGVEAAWQSARAARWPSVDGVVIHSGSRWTAHPRALHRSVWSYDLDLRYTYTVNGRQYQGSRARFSIWGPAESFNPMMTALLRRYPAGTRISPRIDPQDPSRSVLDSSPQLSDWLAIVVGVTLLSLGIRYARRAEAEKHAHVVRT